jgi:hypothetical protein
MLSHTLQQLHQNGIPVTSVSLFEAATSASGVAAVAMEHGEPPKPGQQSTRRRRK